MIRQHRCSSCNKYTCHLKFLFLFFGGLYFNQYEIIDLATMFRGKFGTVDGVFRFAFPPVPLDDHKSIGTHAF